MRLRFIPTIYHNVLRFLGTSSTRQFQGCEIPFAQTRIEAYCDRLQAQYKLEGSQRMEGFYVEEVKLYKSVGTSKHEYLVAKVRTPNRAPFYLAFERGRGKIIHNDTSEERDITSDIQLQAGLPVDSALSPSAPAPPPEPGPTSRNRSNACPTLSQTDDVSASTPGRNSFFKINPMSSSSSTLASHEYVIRKHKADDKVTPLDSSGKHKGNHVLFRKLSFSSPSTSLEPTTLSSSYLLSEPQPAPSCLHLYELAVLANTFHRTESQCLLLSDNCHFYASTIIKMLEEMYHPMVVVEMTGSHVVDMAWKGKKKTQKLGTWHDIEVCGGETVEIASLKAKFEQGLRDFCKPVCLFFGWMLALADNTHISFFFFFLVLRSKTTRLDKKPRTF